MANKNFEVKHGLSVGGTERITAAGAGSFTDLALSGDLNITGDVNSVSVTDLDVTDKTITLGKGQVESASSGSGIVVDGSNASMLWDESNDEFDFNKGINITGNLNLSGDIFGTSNFDIRSTGNIFNTYGNSSNVYFRTQDGTNRAIINSSGNIGIGTTSPDSFNSRGRNLVVNSDGDTGITISANTSSSSTLLFADSYAGTGGTTAYRGSIEYDHATDHMAISTAATERMRIDSNGRVGIGTTSPGALLDLSGVTASSTPKLRFSGTGEASAGDAIGQIDFHSGDTTDYTPGIMASIKAIAGPSGGEGHLQFLTDMPSEGAAAATVALHLNGNGNVGIGTASPSQKLHVVGGQARFDDHISIQPTKKLFLDGGNDTYIDEVAANTIAFHNAGAERMRITSSGYFGMGETTPTSKLHISANSVAGGIFVDDSSNSNSAPVIKVLGKRSDANKSQSFSGGLALKALYTGGLSPSTKHTGTIYFGTNHTDGTEANIAYAASISGYMTGDANSTTDMPMGINFHTGSTGRALGTANVTFGDERMRISGNGDVMLGNTVVNPASGFSNQKGFGYDFSHGTTEIAVDSDTTCLVLGRNHGNNGVMQTFRKQSTSFAEIGIEGGDSLYIQGGSTSGSGILLHGSGAKVLPARSRTSIDNAIDLGQSSRKWKKGWFYSLDVSDAAVNCSVVYEALNVVQANSGDSNTAMGYQALEKTTTGDHNVGVGYRAGMNNLSGVYNALFGRHAGYSMTSGGYNTAIGANSLDANTEGGSNVAVGYNALTVNSTADNNTAVGSQSLKLNTTGSKNTAVGNFAGQACNTGDNNVFIGRNAGYDATDANNNVFIGANTQNDNAGTSNQVILGNTARSQGSGKFTVGTSSSTYSYLTIGGTSWSGSSDERLKKEITDSTAGLSFINDLRPVTFKWKTKGEVDSSLPHYEEGSNEPVIGNSDSNVLTKHGFIAQEVKTAIDNHTGVKDGSEIWEENRDGIQNFSPTALIPMLVKSIQELEARVKELEG